MQYHPEVTHSERGKETLSHFLFTVAGVTAGWSMQNVLDEQLEIVRRKVGPDAHVICALSGGVDSAVAATLVHKAIGDRLHRLAQRTQLLVVTHSPQVAARGAAHLLIAKSHDGTVTRTGVRALGADERREEIARMLSGATITDEARAQADRLIETA